MSEDKAKIDAIVEGSDISDEDKARWKTYLPILPDFMITEMRAILEEKPELVSWFTENWKTKTALLKDKGSNAWDVIAAQEEKSADILLESSS